MNQYLEARDMTNYGLSDEIDEKELNKFLETRAKQALVNLNYAKLISGDTSQLVNEIKLIVKDTCKWGTIETLKQPKNVAMVGVATATTFGLGFLAGKKLKIKRKK